MVEIKWRGRLCFSLSNYIPEATCTPRGSNIELGVTTFGFCFCSRSCGDHTLPIHDFSQGSCFVAHRYNMHQETCFSTLNFISKNCCWHAEVSVSRRTNRRLSSLLVAFFVLHATYWSKRYQATKEPPRAGSVSDGSCPIRLHSLDYLPSSRQYLPSLNREW